MAEFKPDEAAFNQLRGKVVVLSGAATGIGAVTAKLLVKYGAFVVFGDTNDKAASDVAKANSRITFEHCDVSVYADIYSLFEKAYEKHGRVDHAVSCAGIFEQGNWFDPALTMDTVSEQGNTEVMDVNVMGTLNFCRIAAVFLRDGMQNGKQNKSIVLLSSVSAFRESPGLYLYQTSKHAIQGILRSSRKFLWERDGVRINAVNPGVTDTPMAAGIAQKFRDEGVYVQSPESVANIILGLITKDDLVGKAVYVEGGDGWEFEDSFYRESQDGWAKSPRE
ncbi:hypothetical protein LTR27_001855 [Elasticomyces elasticus]|nr:hypothetical protein LTR27_001855 [Elasticomyces elasticus]